jgi:NADP-dependent 3-hydroxy acid dehydrogenase YdfG
MESKVVVITGASSGIGAALAKNLGTKGHRLVLAARREELLKQVAAESGTQTLTVVTDVTRGRIWSI